MIATILIIMIVYTLIMSRTLLKNKKEKIYCREIPSNDSPAFVGKIIKGHVDGNDLIATILDLTYKGYIRIEIERIKGKEKRVLYLQKNVKSLELKEYEIFIINQIFKTNEKIIFDDYIKSSKFKQDFKVFDNMMDRRSEIRRTYKTSVLKNINKIILLTLFLLFGIIISYSIVLPITMSISSMITDNTKIKVIGNIAVSGLIYILVSYKYISYINKTTNAQENINLIITYIILSVIICLTIGFNSFEKIFEILNRELNWYNIIINFSLSAITILYMFNILRKKEDYLYYFFIIVGIIAIIIGLKLTMGICTIFLGTYIFLKSPKHVKLEQDDYIYKWLGFKEYLEDYSLMSEQEENAMLIWEKYLIYAVSLGVNKKIIKKYGNLNNTILLDDLYLKKFYTEYFE